MLYTTRAQIINAAGFEEITNEVMDYLQTKKTQANKKALVSIERNSYFRVYINHDLKEITVLSQFGLYEYVTNQLIKNYKGYKYIQAGHVADRFGEWMAYKELHRVPFEDEK